MPRVDQHDLDHYRKLAAYIEETIARDEAAHERTVQSRGRGCY